MPARDIILALIVVLAWGSNFSGMKLALEEVPPLLFVGLRFFILLPLLFFLPRPTGWWPIIGVGLFINMGQFAFMFSAMVDDVSAGLASLLIQSQAPITILLAALFFGERVGWLQSIGIGLAVAGLAVFGISGGGNVTPLGLALVLLGALCWAFGNLILRKSSGVNMMALFVWASLIPPLPMLGLSMLIEGPTPFATIWSMSLMGWGAVIYVAVISTLLGYSLWGALLSRHPAAIVTPFALLIPVVGISVAAVVLGERITWVEMVATVLILAGLALAVLGPRWIKR